MQQDTGQVRPHGGGDNGGMHAATNPSSPPLRRVQVFTLRPHDAGTRALLSALRLDGAQAYNLAPLRLVAIPPEAFARQADPLAGASHWLFTSPAAVRMAASLAARAGLDLFAPGAALAQAGAAGRVFAPGPGSAEALQRLGITAQVPVGRYDSEGILALPALSGPLQGHVVIVGAPGGRGLLAPALRERGARVTLFHVYARQPRPLPARHLARLAAAPQAVLVASSGAMLAALVAQLRGRRREVIPRAGLVVASTRLQAQARELGFRTILVAGSARPADLHRVTLALVSSAAPAPGRPRPAAGRARPDRLA